MLIGLIRHGETDWNAAGLLQGASDIPLNATGREQAAGAARMLKGGAWSRVYSSPMQRAMDTARIIAEGIGAEPPEPLEGVRERAYGVFEGKAYRYPDGTRVSLDDPSVEPLDTMLDRALGALRELAQRHGPDDRILVVAHGTVIRTVLDAFLAERAPSVANASLSLLRANGATFDVVTANGYPVRPIHATSGDDPSVGPALDARVEAR